METRRELITRNGQVSVGTTLVQISGRLMDGVRKGITLRNSSLGGQVISISPSDHEPAVAYSGIVLSSGQNLSDFTSEGYEAWQGNITAIASAAGGVLSVHERVLR